MGIFSLVEDAGKAVGKLVRRGGKGAEDAGSQVTRDAGDAGRGAGDAGRGAGDAGSSAGGQVERDVAGNGGRTGSQLGRDSEGAGNTVVVQASRSATDIGGGIGKVVDPVLDKTGKFILGMTVVDLANKRLQQFEHGVGKGAEDTVKTVEKLFESGENQIEQGAGWIKSEADVARAKAASMFGGVGGTLIIITSLGLVVFAGYEGYRYFRGSAANTGVNITLRTPAAAAATNAPLASVGST